ncbi:hypothetical protein JOC85_000542 [Bacillus mesophilus]|nr:hypothetical protein [Bacillus mesophilus]MBM7659775.1 hypothetical protein [Bacillus mesophilus]
MSEIQEELELLLDQEESNLTVVGKNRLRELLKEAEKQEGEFS